MRKACRVSIFAILLAAGVMAAISVGRGGQEKESPDPSSSDTTKKLLMDLEQQNRFVRAAAIDLLGQRKAVAAIPKLIDLLSDTRALQGSDNWVGAHAANALATITGKRFNLDQKAWQAWWDGQKKQPGATDEVLLSQVKDLAQQVRKSELIVVGKLTILRIRDGHVGGTLHVSEVLFGRLEVKQISFSSEMMALEADKERIWFLSRSADDPDRAVEIAARLISSGATVADKDAVRWLIARIKQPGQAGEPAGAGNKKLDRTEEAELAILKGAWTAARVTINGQLKMDLFETHLPSLLMFDGEINATFLAGQLGAPLFIGNRESAHVRVDPKQGELVFSFARPELRPKELRPKQKATVTCTYTLKEGNKTDELILNFAEGGHSEQWVFFRNKPN